MTSVGQRGIKRLDQHLDDLAAFSGAQGAVDNWTATSGAFVVALVAEIDRIVTGISGSLDAVGGLMAATVKLHARAAASAAAAGVDPPPVPDDPVEQIAAGLPGRQRRILELIRSGAFADQAAKE